MSHGDRNYTRQKIQDRPWDFEHGLYTFWVHVLKFLIVMRTDEIDGISRALVIEKESPFVTACLAKWKAIIKFRNFHWWYSYPVDANL